MMKALVVLLVALVGIATARWLNENEFRRCVQGTQKGSGRNVGSAYQAFANRDQSAGGISSRLEAFFAVAQMSWESDGFDATQEYACKDNTNQDKWPCNTYKKTDWNGAPCGTRNYYGRGYIQLSHCGNYKAASWALYGDNRLVDNPDQVAYDPAAMDTALWYWKANVHSHATSNDFGATTRAINGQLDCVQRKDIGAARFQKARACLQAAAPELAGQINNNGCQ